MSVRQEPFGFALDCTRERQSLGGDAGPLQGGGCALQCGGSRIAHMVDPMAYPHDAAAGRELRFEPGSRTIGTSDGI